jgi:hypothetical protein
MKRWLKNAAWVAAMTLVVPQLFVVSYFFPLVVSGGNRLELLRSLALLGLSASWVSAPFFVVALLLYRALVAMRLRWYATLLVCALAGYLWVAAWNHAVYDLFAYGRSALPVLVCSLVTAGYALARRFYFKNLPPPAKAEPLATGS